MKKIPAKVLVIIFAGFTLAYNAWAEEKTGESQGFIGKVLDLVIPGQKTGTQGAGSGPGISGAPGTAAKSGTTPGESVEQEEKAPPTEEITKEEMLERIKASLRAFPEIREFIPELKIEYDEDGQISGVEYNIEGVFRSLEDLDKDDLVKIYNRISIERTRINTERIQKQLQSIQASQNIQRQSRPYVPPVQHTAPVPPRVPQAPPKAPVPPPVPPQPPKR